MKGPYLVSVKGSIKDVIHPDLQTFEYQDIVVSIEDLCTYTQIYEVVGEEPKTYLIEKEIKSMPDTSLIIYPELEDTVGGELRTCGSIVLDFDSFERIDVTSQTTPVGEALIQAD